MIYPKFKQTLKPLIKKQGVIEINLSGVSTELEDLDGKIEALIDMLDGKNDLNKIADSLAICKEDIISAVNDLADLGFVEESEIDPSFSDIELEQYQSNFNFFSAFSSIDYTKFDMQKKLKNSKVTVLGLGGGCLTAAYLAGLGIGEIVGVDYDTVSRSNLNRQFLYNETDIGKLKSEVSEEKIRKINSSVKVRMYNKKIKNYEELLPIIEGSDLVINMMDQPAIVALRWVNAACCKLGIPFYSGGFTHQFIFWERYIPNNGACYDCKLIHQIQTDFDNYYRIKTYYGKIFNGVNTGFAPNLSILTGFFLSDAVNLITGIAPLLKEEMTLDTASMSFNHSDFAFSKHPKCPTCGNRNFDFSDLNELIKVAEMSGEFI